MKTIFKFFLLFLPVIVFAQNPPANPMTQKEWHYLGTPGFSMYNCYEIATDVSSSGQIYVAYIDDAAYQEVTVQKYDGTDWVNVGSGVISPGSARALSMAISPSGEPYVAYCDNSTTSNNGKLMKFDGTNWIYVGGIQGFFIGSPHETKIAFSPTGEPYIAYVSEFDNHGYVVKFSGNSFVQVGASFSYTAASYIDMKFSPGGSPCVSFVDTYHSDKISVLKYDGTDWIYIGLAGFSSNSGAGTSLTFNSAGDPYVAYYDSPDNTTYSLHVKKYEGSGWIDVGNQSFVSGPINLVSACSIAFDPLGQLYLTSNIQSSTPVSMYNGTSWSNVGANTPAGIYITLSIFSGLPCVGFRDPAYSQKVSVMDYSYPLGIDRNPEQCIQLYPSPVKTNVVIELPGTPGEIKKLEILDCAGTRMMVLNTCDDKVNLNVGYFSPGTYMVRIRTGSSLFTEKFVKMD